MEEYETVRKYSKSSKNVRIQVQQSEVGRNFPWADAAFSPK